MAETLTLETLMDVAKALGPIRPRQRLIVGFPLVGEDEWIRAESRGLWLVGRLAWRRFLDVAITEWTWGPSESPASTQTLMGIPVEEYDPAYHGELARELALELIRHRGMQLSEQPK